MENLSTHELITSLPIFFTKCHQLFVYRDKGSQNIIVVTSTAFRKKLMRFLPHVYYV